MVFHRLVSIGLVAGLSLAGGCSVKRVAMNQVATALSGDGGVFASDNDPELVGDALPFSLKLMESVLESTPDHVGLLTSLTSGFAQYGYGWTQLKADFIEEQDYDRAVELRTRAVNLYLRAKGYGLRGLEQRYPGFGAALRADHATAVARLKAQDVELIYWTALSWAGAISLSLDDASLVGDLAYVESMMERALALNPDWDNGSLHSFFVTYEMSRMNGEGDPVQAATEHYRRAVDLSRGQLASVFVGYAEAVAVSEQNKELFVELLERALAIDVDAHPNWRLNNLLYQQRAKWLLSRLDWLFI